MGSVRSSPAERCCGGPHSVVAGILQFFDHLAEISVPWQLIPEEMCVIGQHTVSHCFSFCICSSFNELGHYAAKVRGKLIVFGSAVFDDIRNHIASVVFESVNIFFFVCFCCFVLFLTCKWSLFLHFVGFGLRVSSHCVLLNFSGVTEP